MSSYNANISSLYFGMEGGLFWCKLIGAYHCLKRYYKEYPELP